MRRAQSVRNYPRPSPAIGTDDLGVLREADETNEDMLRRQLLDKDRENDKLQTQIQLLQAQLAQRPPLESVQQLEKEYKNLDLLLQGTQRENERCMTELDRAKTREKMLEQALSRLAGENWQSSLDLTPAIHATAAQSSPVTTRRPALNNVENQDKSRSEEVRMLILGMEQRLQAREQKLLKVIEKAENQGAKFDQQQKLLSTSS
ncbi:hypothetical protein H0H93_004904 [Arthromyces matolae]|nr:hypothetical protein H0H93_004904 [Arthromyces matolae]